MEQEYRKYRIIHGPFKMKNWIMIAFVLIYQSPFTNEIGTSVSTKKINFGKCECTPAGWVPNMKLLNVFSTHCKLPVPLSKDKSELFCTVKCVLGYVDALTPDGKIHYDRTLAVLKSVIQPKKMHAKMTAAFKTCHTQHNYEIKAIDPTCESYRGFSLCAFEWFQNAC